MKRHIIVGVILGVFFSAVASGSLSTKIRYEATEPDPGKWQYTYAVTNISLTVPIEEFTIWFNYGLYENLAVETPEPLKSDWDEIVVQPEQVLKDDGYYDALALTSGIGVGQMVTGFAVSFDWLGTGEPGSQFYEIIDPSTFETIDSGYTVPEPTTFILFCLSGAVLCRRRRTEGRA